MATLRRHIVLRDSAQTEELQPGDVVHSRVRKFVWTKHHLRGSQLEPCVDPNAFQPSPRAYRATLDGGSGATRSRTRRSQRSLRSRPLRRARRPRRSTSSSTTSGLRPRTRAIRTSPRSGQTSRGCHHSRPMRAATRSTAGRARALVEAGQQVYTTYSGPISLALLVGRPTTATRNELMA
jgi:hypothetical protein